MRLFLSDKWFKALGGTQPMGSRRRVGRVAVGSFIALGCGIVARRGGGRPAADQLIVRVSPGRQSSFGPTGGRRILYRDEPHLRSSGAGRTRMPFDDFGQFPENAIEGAVRLFFQCRKFVRQFQDLFLEFVVRHAVGPSCHQLEELLPQICVGRV
ncbi:MAG: hypothetical protein ACT4QC_17770 [Planctomycetaceae bacterium]